MARMVTVPAYAEQPRCFEATTLVKAHSRIWAMANLWSTTQPKNGGHSLLTLRLTLPALLRSVVRR